MRKMVVTIREMLKGALWFGVLGPPIGSLLFWMAILASSIAERDGGAFTVAFGTIIFLLPYSYIFGLIPAVLSGLIVGPFRPSIHSWPRYFGVGLICSLVSLACGAVLTLLFDESIADVTFLAAFFFGPAFVAGTVVARLWGHRPNNSFKPKPLRGSA